MAHKTDHKKPPAPEIGEVATAGSALDITSLFIGELASSTDDILKARGGDLSLYKKVLSDDQVFSNFQQRGRAVVSKPWDVQPGGDDAIDKKAADFLSEQLEHVRWDRATLQMLFGVFYGYAVAECFWARDGGHVVLDKIKVRDRARFRFSAKDASLRLVTRDKPNGIIMPERKFWTFNTGADNDDEPYGIGLAHWLYWPVLFKRNGIKFWMIFLEKFGMPTAKGEYPPNTTEQERDQLLAAVSAIQTDSGIIVPQGMIIELLEAARSGTADYDTLKQRMDQAITKVILSQTMTTEDGSSLSQAEVHMEVRDEVVIGDACLINESFQDGPALWLTEWNFPGAKTPKIVRKFEDERDVKDQAEIDTMIFDMGFDPSEDYIQETYGDGWTKRRVPPTGGPDREDGEESTQFSEHLHNDDSIDRLAADALSRGKGNALIEPLLKPIKKLVAEADSLEDIRDHVIELLDGMDDAALIEVLAQAGFATRIAGEVRAKTTDRE